MKTKRRSKRRFKRIYRPTTPRRRRRSKAELLLHWLEQVRDLQAQELAATEARISDLKAKLLKL